VQLACLPEGLLGAIGSIRDAIERVPAQ
jgi:hypothetical protein